MNDDNFIIKIEKYEKKDNIPDYSVSILPDGSILYKGTEKINSTDIIPKIRESDLSRLIDEFIDIYFFAMDDKYLQEINMNIPRIEISVKWQNKHKKVVFDDSPGVPLGLIEFQKLTEQIVGINK